MSNLRPLTAVTIGFGIAAFAFAGTASAHANTVACVDQATSTWRITNDYPLAESFTSPQGPAGNVAAGNGSFTDVVYVGDSLQIDAVWTDGFTESRTGTGDCTPEGGTTTTTEFVTTTEATTSTSTTIAVTTTVTATTNPATTSTVEISTTNPSPTTSQPSSSTTLTTIPTTTEPATSSSVVPTSTSLPVGSTTIPETTPSTAPPTTSPTTQPLICADGSTPPCAPPTTTSECVDNPATPGDDCAPICVPVTLEDGSNSCGPPLPATGSNTVGIVIAAWIVILAGIVALGYGAAHRGR